MDFAVSVVTIDVGDGNVADAVIDDAGGDGVVVEVVDAAVAAFDSAVVVSHPIALAAADVVYVDTDDVGTPALVSGVSVVEIVAVADFNAAAAVD